MTGKGFCVKIRLELHAVTCPGVWLCPNGKIALRITSLGSTIQSHRVSPIFPLLFHNEFHFKKTFTRLAALTELERCLEQESLYAELIQWLDPCNQAILLATFETSLADLLYPVTCCKRLLAGLDVDLLMDPSKYFPGIIAPKIEVSTKTVIEEVKTSYRPTIDGTCVINPKMIDSKRKPPTHRKRPVKGIIRQQRVCHNRGKAPAGYRCDDSCQDESARTDRCYHATKSIDLDVPPTNRPRRVPFACGNLRVFDNCPVCLRYKCYFSGQCDSVSSNVSNGKENPTDSPPHDYERRWYGGVDPPDDRFISREPPISPTLRSKMKKLHCTERSPKLL
ncbi:unnamed protein product [Xylocopa violacea]|uniref:Spermatogenesis-associated protein 6 N-terminal domain-containing protein n=1 Tax=Xylocopa violacea TaxID=135666 RepID=A0ABP1PH28_XYLVO